VAAHSAGDARLAACASEQAVWSRTDDTLVPSGSSEPNLATVRAQSEVRDGVQTLG